MQETLSVNRELSLASAIGAMTLIRDGAVNGNLRELGVSEADAEKLMQDAPWLHTDRGVVRAVVDALVYGSMDLQGLPRFDPPAEYVAGVLWSFVSPTNLQVACSWVQGTPRAEELATGALKNAPPATARQLFALCVRLGACDGSVKAAFRKKCGYALERSREVAENAKKK